MPPPSCSRVVSTARCFSRTKRSRGEVQPIYVSVGLAWEEAERAMVSQLSRRPASWPRAPARLADRRHARRLRRHALGRRGHAPRRITRRTKTCICRGATSSCSARRRATAPPQASSASCSARSRTIRFPTRRPIPRRDGRVRLRWGSRTRCRLTLLTPAREGGGHRARHRAGRAARAHVVVHEAGIRESGFGIRKSRVGPRIPNRGSRIPSALRHVQQMPRAPRRVSRARTGRSDGV